MRIENQLEDGGVFYYIPESVVDIKHIWHVTVQKVKPDGSTFNNKFHITASGRKEAAAKAIERAKGHITTMDMHSYHYIVTALELIQ